MPRDISTAQREELSWQAVELFAKQKNYSEIGRELGLDRRTVKTYIGNELARRAEMRENMTEQHIAVYNAIQKSSWEAFNSTPDRSLNKSSYLNTVKACEDSKARLTGAEAPKKHQFNVDMSEGIPEEDLALLSAAEAYLDASEDEGT